MRPRWLTCALAAFTFVAGIAASVRAQSAGFVVLKLKPKAGQVMHTRFEQTVEMTAITHLSSGDTTFVSRLGVVMLSHAIVEQSDPQGTTLVSTTDSVELAGASSSDATTDAARRAMQGRHARLRVAPDGSATLIDSPDGVLPEVQAVVSGIPSTLPDKPVSVHSSWQKTMSIPVAGDAEPSHAATLNATYRLDSLSANGDVAYISVRGTIVRDSTAAPLPGGMRVISSGNVTGTMGVDRRTGWWSESRLVVDMKSTLSRDGANPVHMQTTIVQHMQTAYGP